MVRLLFGGDVMIGRTFNSVFRSNPSYNMWGNTLSMITDVDCFVVNLETSVTDVQTPWPNKAFNFKLSPRYAWNALKPAQIGLVSLANNHIMDFQTAGMYETMHVLNDILIPFTGVGSTLAQARQPTIVTMSNGIRLAMLSAADHPPEWAGTFTRPGFRYIDLQNKQTWTTLFADIERLRTKVDLIIFSIHYGPNWVDRIDPNAIELFHAAIDHGVNIVHGHSAHHVLPVEFYRQGIIMYGCGDLIDDYAVNQTYRNDLGCLFEIDTTKMTEIIIHPTRITIAQRNSKLWPQVNLLSETDPDYDRIIENVNKQI